MRIARLDGIRALAIALVLAAHGLWVESAWTGVDVFFVLSGFLITGILRKSRMEESFWSVFYVKRATRILPPLLILFAAASVLSPTHWQKIWLYYVLFAANIAEAMHHGADSARYFGLGVLWSLAVEEHFYLLWPFAVRYLSRVRLMQVCVFTLILEPILRGIASFVLPDFWPIYFLTPFRLDGLAAGCLLALMVEQESGRRFLSQWSGKLFAVSFAVIMALILTNHFQRQHHWLFASLGYSLVTVVAFALIAYVLLNEMAWISRALSIRPVVFVGRISYGLYLYHLLAMDVVKTWATRIEVIGIIYARHERLLLLLSLSLALLVSWLSFKYYEEPIIRLGHRWSNRLRNSSETVSAKLTASKHQQR